ncbi:MAG TPA: carbon monoxide dehydrogenase subunit G [Thermohalobaculum sp.]|nr:carbon monoxide dehydrogenase subunit G [Thermohalobaculum sp.]
MQMQGERSIDASRSDVWAALNDAEVLKACIPGCETLEKTSPTTFEATVMQKVGPVKARFKGSVELSDIVETEGYTITGEGKGGAAGFAKGGATVRLTDEGSGTLLTYQAEAKVGGKLAQLGSRLIDGFARKMADDFFTRFQQAVEGPASDSDEETETSGDAPDEKKKGWFRRMIG